MSQDLVVITPESSSGDAGVVPLQDNSQPEHAPALLDTSDAGKSSTVPLELNCQQFVRLLEDTSRTLTSTSDKVAESPRCYVSCFSEDYVSCVFACRPSFSLYPVP